MKADRLVVFALVLGASVAGCAGIPADRPDCVRLSAQTGYCLRPATAMAGALPRRDLVDVSRDSDRRRFIGQMAIEKGEWVVSATSPLGTGLFEIVHAGRGVSVSGPAAGDASFDAGRLLAMLQLLFLPAEEAREGLYGARLRETETGRVLMAGGRRVLVIESAADGAGYRVTMPARGLSITITPL